MPAVNSGRRVIESPERSSKEYISLDTTSVVSPIVRANTAVGSISGTSTRLKPYRRRTRSKAATTSWKRSASSPSRLCVPRTGCGVEVIAAAHSIFAFAGKRCRFRGRAIMRIDLIPSGADVPNSINVLIEVPIGGEPVKYEFDKPSGAIFVDRILHTP